MRIERLPLNALRAFSAAARAGSFKHAAAHLGVTPGAVSRQIKQLEERLGVSLFDRQASGVQLNDVGRQLARDIDDGLARIAAGVLAAEQRAKARGRHASRLTISAPPTFAQRWLLPRLSEFEAQVGGVEISLDASQSLSLPSWQADGAHLAIRYGRGPWPGVNSHRLLRDELFPVCAPSLLARDARPLTPADLAHHSLLEVHWDSPRGVAFPGWREWLEAAGVADKVSSPQRYYSLSGLALDQAIAGRGVMLANDPIVRELLENGVLTRPFGEQFVLASPLTYELLTPQNGEIPPAIARFIEWLLNEAALFDAATTGNPR